MPSSYVYLAGELAMDAAVGKGGKIEVLFSDNNGLDWQEVAAILKSGKQKIDLGKLVLRRYDYRLPVRAHRPGHGTGRPADRRHDPVFPAGPAHARPGRQHDQLLRRSGRGHGHRAGQQHGHAARARM